MTSAIVTASEPYRPAFDSQVLQRLPSQPLMSRDEMAILRSRLLDDPNSAELAVAAAKGYLKVGGETSDPRFYGYAQAALDGWIDDPSPPPAIVKLWAKLDEKNHLYADAIDRLQKLALTQPDDIQVWIELANLHRVVGDYRSAWAACENLDQYANKIQAAIGKIPLMMVNGQATEAAALLDVIGRWAVKEQPSMLNWTLTRKAEASRTLGENDDAEKYYREALGKNDADLYLRRSMADFYLDQGRPEDALRLVEDHVVDTGSLLLAAIAAERTGDFSRSSEWKSQLESRFRELRLRNASPHGRFESRYELELNGNPTEALEIALANWRQQKETADARRVLEAAIASKRPEEADAIVQFLRDSGNEDVKLKALIDRLSKR